MRNPTPRDVRRAVLLTAFVTAIVTIALLDPSCRRQDPPDHAGPTRSLSPQ